MASTTALSPAKRALLERWTQGHVDGPEPAGLHIPRRPAGARAPLSLAQERIWAHQRLRPASPLYTSALAIDIPFPVDPALLRQALDQVVQRHEPLRSCFPVRDGAPAVEVKPRLDLEVAFSDLAGRPSEERERAAAELLEAEARTVFDVERGPLLRARLVRLGAESHRLLIAVHQLVADSWSVGVLGADLLAYAMASAGGDSPPLAELAVEFGDYTWWQRSPEEEARRSRQLEYFRQRLAGAPVLELATDRPRPPLVGQTGSDHRFLVPAGLLADLTALSRREGATPFMAVLAAFYVLLHRYSGQTDIVVGSPVLGRNQPELAPMVGCFINTVALRTDLSGDPTFLELLKRVRETVTGAYANQEAPVEQLYRESSSRRDASRMPLFQVVLNWQAGDFRRVQAAGFPLADMRRAATGAADGYDLVLDLRDLEGGISAALEYPFALFTAAGAERMAGQLLHLLQEVAADPDRRLTRLPLTGRAQLQSALAAAAGAPAPRPPSCLHRLFEAQVARTPRRIAIEFEDRRLTYSALNRRADRVACRLRRLGVGADGRVAIVADRSVELVAGILGVLKAGAAYVPIDADQPAARLAAMLEDCRPAAVLTVGGQQSRLPAVDAPVVLLDSDAEIESPAELEPAAAVHGDNLAYVLYTSGSTGRPKGVQVSHRAILNRLLWTIETHGFRPRDRFLLKTPHVFDASIWEVFVPLLIGARLVVARPGGHQDASYLAEVIADRRVSVLQLVPSMLQVLLEVADWRRLRSLRQVFCGGEALHPDLKDRFCAASSARLHNLYGPTEAAIDVASWTCDPAPGTPVPIGRPIANTRLYVLDDALEPVAPGVPGLLHVAGPGLARGYLGRPRLTAESFLPDPQAALPGGRMYATGDLSRQLPDGSVQFLRRRDQQVKVRGFRIELGEVEQALRAAPGVAEAAAAVRGEGDQARLIGYVTGPEGGRLDPAEVRSQLRDRLPGYMVPSAVVILEQLPRLPSGKLNRQALPEPEPPSPAAAALAGADPPRTATEVRLAGLWSELLPAPPVSIADDFFELGGHSLLAILLASRVRAAFGCELPLAAIFEVPRLGSLASRLDALVAEAGDSAAATAVPIARAARDGELPLSFAQQRLWFLEHFVPGRPFYNMPIPIRLRGTLDLPALRQALNEIVRRHEVLRARFPEVDGKPVQVIAPVLEVEVAVTDAAGLSEAEVRARGEELGARVFDLAAGPVIRADLLQLEADDHLLLVVVHHIACDGWSAEVLAGELGVLYQAISEGRPSPLPEPAVQYLDFAAWQRERLQGERLAAGIGYWRERLRGAPAVLDLPTDGIRPAVQSYRSGHVAFSLDAAARTALESLAHTEGATLFMALLAGLLAVLHLHSGQREIVAGTPVAGRGRPELEGLIGLFVNTLPIRGDLTDDPTFRELLLRVKRTTLEAFAHQDVPFEMLVEELETDRDLSRTPLFQAMLAFQRTGLREAAAGGLLMEPVLMEVSPTRCDLTLYVLDTGSQLRGSFEYVEELIARGRIERIAGHLGALLEMAAAAPERHLSELSPLGAAERRWLVEESNATADDYPAADLACLFTEQAAATPDLVAASDGGGQATYRELDARAGRLAAALAATGAGPEQVVGVLDDRGLPLLTSLLAILKAGAAYLPLDPALPPARLAQMLAQSGTGLVVAGAKHRPLLARAAGELPPERRPAVLLAGSPLPDALQHHCSGPSALAYVVFTSGSTGLPKGAMVEQRSLLNHLHAKVRELGLSASDRIAQTAAVGFDISIWQLLAGLLVGARTTILGDDITHDPGRLLEALARGRVTVAETVPAMLAALLEHLEGRPAPDLGALRWLLVTGEALPPSLCDRWRERFPRIPLLNAYGPTECGDDVSHHVVPAGTMADQPRVPIGRPLMNTRLYVLRAPGELAPRGAAGELVVGGDGVGRGYAGDPRRTAAAFVPDPFGPPGARAYRTGDLARHREDGLLEHLGRTDHQLKLRGHRVEPGEIEAALGEHPGLREVAVVAQAGDGDQARLVAYYVEKAGVKVAAEDLRRRLQQRLPEYMLPAAFVRLESLPRTAAAKLDRQALPAAGGRPDLPEYEPPQGPAEVMMARIWADLLGLDRVGVTDNFFALGGHSLLAMQLVSRIRKGFRLDVPLAAVFQAQTIAQLARALEAGAPPGRLDRIAEVVMRVEQMSGDEVSAALAARP